MKVFISWSGSRSKKVASIFHNWLPSVIQSIEPFVSSEDIEKGSRWNTDIAQELKESSFGIICVTKDNLNSPWLNFEAGALSKTIENSYVAPFLFDIKPSELKDSPISQFQSTSFVKDDLKRLIETLNVAASNCLTEQKLSKTFEVWYPELEQSLTSLVTEPSQIDKDYNETEKPDLLEEILEMSRNTQRLLGNTDVKLLNNIDMLHKKLETMISKNDRFLEIDQRRYPRKMSPLFFEKIFYQLRHFEKNDGIYLYNLLIVFSLYKDDFPWLYDSCYELVRILQSNETGKSKIIAIRNFRRIFEISTEHNLIRESFRFNKDSMMIFNELPMILENLENHINSQYDNL